MERKEYSRFRDIVGWQLETLAQAPFIIKVKGYPVLQESVWIIDVHIFTKEEIKADKPLPVRNCLASDALKHGRFDGWQALEHLSKTAATMHSEFKNLWKWVVKTYPYRLRTSFPKEDSDFSTKYLYNFLYLDLKNLLFLLMYNEIEELENWKTALKNGTPYILPST